MPHAFDRRLFLHGSAAATAGALLGPGKRAPSYAGPNVIVVRFGGGARRRETIDAEHTYSPFLCHELAQRGTLFTGMEISAGEGIETGHGHGTLNILTGRYEHHEDVEGRFLGERFEPKAPTLFEYLRKSFDVADHETLIVNGEDRIDEEFYTFSNHHQFGIRYRSQVLSLYRFKTWLLARQLEEELYEDDERGKKEVELDQMLSLDVRSDAREPSGPIGAFWSRWRAHYGDSGLVNPRGDRLLTELTLRALAELKPRLALVNYQDCDYVHWGNMAHYTRGVSVMDEGLRRIVDRVEADEFYRGNTIVVVVPDCGRDSNRMLAIPCQHHFGSRSAREIFALFVGPRVPADRRIERTVDQIQVAATVGALMGTGAEHTDGEALSEVLE